MTNFIAKKFILVFILFTAVLWGGNDAYAATIDVSILADGSFSPADITIDTGDTVRWTNTSGAAEAAVATFQHLIHKNYPDPKCPAFGCLQSTHINLNESFSFTFMIGSADVIYDDEELSDGTWSYHNHEKAARKGTVTVIDLNAPATTTDLAAADATTNSVNLTWTSPGNDVGNTGNFRTPASYDIRYSTTPITENNWASATQATGEPTPQEAGSAESMNVSGLTTGVTYYFALKTSDDAPAPNISTLSNSPSAIPGAGGGGGTRAIFDEVFPAVISDLSEQTKTSTSVTITWTAPGDDGNEGTALLYDIRYFHEEITRTVWDRTNKVTREPLPQVAGSTESMTIPGLTASTTYYFAVSTIDDFFNQAAFSNVLKVTTSPPPDLTPPSKITDLTLKSVSISKGSLISWTAPGDDGNVGTAARYAIRFGPLRITGLITDESWDSMYSFLYIPIPQKAGSKESMVALEMNQHGATYQIAIKALDEEGNESPVSNVLSFTNPPKGYDTGEVHIHEDGEVHIHEIEEKETVTTALKEGSLVRYAGDDKVYVISGIWKVLIPTSEIFNSAGFDPGDIIEPGNDVLDGYTTSAPISDGDKGVPDATYDVSINPDKSFSPQIVNINTGDTVRWTSLSDDNQVAGNVHPLHTGYLDPQCPNPGCWDSNFLFADDTYSFTFMLPGSFGYHNHRKSDLLGRINVRDLNAPATIDDLTVSTADRGSVNLAWTAPGDNTGITGSFGTPLIYDVRYSTSTITGDTWDAAIRAQNEPSPRAAGAIETMSIEGLNASDKYYFAIKTLDNSLNESKISLPPAVTAVGAITATPEQGGRAMATTDEGIKAELKIPPGAILQDTKFEITPLLTTTPDILPLIAILPPEKKIVGSYIFDYTATVLDAVKTDFLSELTIFFSYRDLQTQSVDEETIEIQRYDEKEKKWMPATSTLDIKNNTVTAQIQAFSRFALVASKDTDPPPPPLFPIAKEIERGNVTLTWTNPLEDFSHVKIYRSEKIFELGELLASLVRTGSFIDTKDITSTATYYYTVRSVDPAGNESANTNQAGVYIVGNSEEIVSDFVEGDLIRGPDGIKVYIINEHGHKRRIFNPSVFNMYGHLSWENIKDVSQELLDSYKTSYLYRADGDYKVYSLEEIDGASGIALKRHINLTPEQFIAAGYDWGQVFIVNTEERDYYSATTPAVIGISISADGFSPSIINIKQGDTVRWTNNDTIKHWVATDVHPTHTVYPGSDVLKCGTTQDTNVFDSCRAIDPGDEYTFIFTQPGTWNYHDHLFPSDLGTVIVAP